MLAGEEAPLIQRNGNPLFEIYKTTPLTGADDQDSEKFFEQFEYLASLVPNLAADVKLVELKKCLRDRALTVYQAGSATRTDTFDHLKDYLLANLVLPHQRSVHMHAFHARKKEEKETVSDYYRDLQRLARLAYPAEADASRDLVVKECFIAGLVVTAKTHSNYKIWKASLQAATGSLRDVLSAAHTAETAVRTLSLVADMATGLAPNTTTEALTAMATMTNSNARGSVRGGRYSRGGRGGGRDQYPNNINRETDDW